MNLVQTQKGLLGKYPAIFQAEILGIIHCTILCKGNTHVYFFFLRQSGGSQIFGITKGHLQDCLRMYPVIKPAFRNQFCEPLLDLLKLYFTF